MKQYTNLNVGGSETRCLDVKRHGAARKRAGGLRANMEGRHDHRGIAELLLLANRKHLARLRAFGLTNGVDDVGSHLGVQTMSFTEEHKKNKLE